jgi:hypothetical protein
MFAALVLAVAFWAGQLVDGHVHKTPHAGVLAHCGAHLLETAVYPDRIDVWLLNEKEQTQEPRGKQLAMVVEGPQLPRRRILLKPRGDHFRETFDVNHPTQLSMKVELRDGARVCRASIGWTQLDARDRLDDQMESGGLKQ